jgi:hypothetical protein
MIALIPILMPVVKQLGSASSFHRHLHDQYQLALLTPR